MEVHPPEHPIHTKRDFFLHLFTITVGLLIALSLEGGVEYLHHRHIVREARENIRREIEDNHRSALSDLKLLQESIDRQSANIQAIRVLRTHPKHFHGSVNNSMDFSSMEDAAWRTARDTGALAYMPYDEVQRYADLYMLADLVNQSSVKTAEADFLASAPFDIGDEADSLPDADYTKLLHDNAGAKIQMVTLRQMVQQLDDACQHELKH